MKAKTFFFLSIVLLLSACNTNSLYSKFDDGFEGNRWEQSDTKTHEFTITEDTKPYDVVLRFSHVYDYQFASVPIVMQITDPSGKQESSTIDLMIKDNSGNQVADCSGDVCDLEFKIKDKIKLEKGKYQVILSHAFKGPYLPNVLGVGLDVKISE